MGRALTEKKVLDKLGIDNFRQLTKDKVIEMASMLDKMDPEVAKKALDQFPDFAKTMKEILVEYKGFLSEGLKSNQENTKSFFESCDCAIQECQRVLDKDNLSFDEKHTVIMLMLEIAKMKKDANSENNKFITCLATTGIAALGIAATALVSVLGGNVKVDFDSIRKI